MPLVLAGATSGSTTIQATDAVTQTITLPNATGTAVLDTATQTLTNKTLSSPLTMGTSVLTSGTSQATTSGTFVDFTGIPSWVKRITVMFNGVSTSGTANIQIQLGDSGGLETTGYTSSSGQTVHANTGFVASSTTGFNICTTAAACIVCGSMTILNISGSIWVSSHSAAITSAVTICGGGTKTLSGTLDRIRITTVGGTDTFDAGSVNILYE